MRTLKTSNIMRGAAVATLAGALAIGGAANAQQYRAPTGGGPGSIVSCDAPGGKQMGGALIGALVGAAAGSNLAKNDRGTGTAIGAVAGAATGSWVGCKMQRDAANTYYGQQQPAYRPATYVQNGYRLNSNLSPAAYVRDSGSFVANSTLTCGPPRPPRRRASAPCAPARPSRPWRGSAAPSGSWWGRAASASATSTAPTSSRPGISTPTTATRLDALMFVIPGLDPGIHRHRLIRLTLVFMDGRHKRPAMTNWERESLLS